MLAAALRVAAAQQLLAFRDEAARAVEVIEAAVAGRAVRDAHHCANYWETEKEGPARVPGPKLQGA